MSAHRRKSALFGLLAAILLYPATALVATADLSEQTAAQAGPNGRRVELMQLRTETAQVFLEPSGTHTLEQYAYPVRVRQGTEWAPIDTTLRFDPDGSVRPGATVGDLTLSGGGPGADLLALGNQGEAIHLGWLGKLPRPALSGSTATYAEVLPGVDLLIQADSTGFTQLLKVKTRAAAANPALRRVRFPLSGDGLSISTKPDGTTVAADPNGRTVFSSGAAVMWDNPGAAATVRTATLKTVRSGQDLVIEPDTAMLTAPAARFPLYIDPSFAAGQYRWSQVNKKYEDKSYWNTLRGRAFVGYAEFGKNAGETFRSFFQLDTGPLIGSTVSSAKFQIVLDETGVPKKTSVDLWSTGSIDPSRSLTWDNSRDKWIRKLASAKGSADPANQPDMAMEFADQSILDLVRNAAANRKSFVTVGLRAPDEDEGDQWKVFYWDTAKIVVSYNNAPRVPIKVNFNRPQPCGTATAPTVISTTQPTFGAVASDLDNDNLTTRLTIRRADTDAVVHEVDSALTTSAAAFAWPQVPTGKLTEGTTYSYGARSDDAVADDGIASGPTSPACYFTVDQTPPPRPTLASTDYPDGSAVLPARTAGVVTVRAPAGDTDTTEFYYGFQQDRLNQRIQVGPDGTAKLPVTVIPDEVDGPGDARLFVRAADRAGQLSSITPGWSLRAKPNPAPAPHVRGDINGDGRADAQAVLDHGNGRTAVWNLLASGDGLHGGQVAWDSGNGGGYPLDRTRTVAGDFDGDGRSDVALFREEAGRRMSLQLLRSDGNGYVAEGAPSWQSGPDSWTHTTGRIASGDVDGDNRADIAVQVNNGDGTWKVQIFHGGALGAPTEWLRGVTGDWAHSSLQLADLDGNGSDDLVTQKSTTTCRTVTELYRSTGTAFSPTAVTVHDSGANGYCLERSKQSVGDVDGDGRDDLIAGYDNSDTDLGIIVFRSTGTPGQPTLTPTQWWRTPGEFDPAKVTISAGDINADGRDDLTVLTATSNGGRQAYLLTSTGTAFGPRQLAWQGTAVAAVTGPKFELEQRAYELVARHSRRCLQVKDAGQADDSRFEQATCADALHQRFRVDQIAGTEQAMLHPAHIDGAGLDGRSRCLDVSDESLADDAPVVQWACFGSAYQQFTVEPTDGTTNDTIVRLRMTHSGKCVGVRGAATSEGAAVVQQTCTTAASQQWILRPAATGKQLDSRYRISSVRGGKVVDVTNCVKADGADLRTWNWNSGSPCQRWQLKPLGDDIYQIVDPNSGKAVDVQACSEENVAIVHLWAVSESPCQRWRIEPAYGGSWSIRQTITGKAMDVGGCRDDAGADLIIWPYWNGPCQRWKLDRYDN